MPSRYRGFSTRNSISFVPFICFTSSTNNSVACLFANISFCAHMYEYINIGRGIKFTALPQERSWWRVENSTRKTDIKSIIGRENKVAINFKELYIAREKISFRAVFVVFYKMGTFKNIVPLKGFSIEIFPQLSFGTK